MKTRSLYQPTDPSAPTNASVPDFQPMNQNREAPLHCHSSDHTATSTAFPDFAASPSMNMPPVEGMVDLQTLGKISEVLTASHHEDDTNLATWIRAHYLPHDPDWPIEQGGCAIKGAVGFAKLYNAYKRARVLTNRAQDKWPFFDRRWKSMTTAQVTKMATREDDAHSSDSSAVSPPKSLSLTSPAADDTASTAALPQDNESQSTLKETTTNQHTPTTASRTILSSMQPDPIKSTSQVEAPPTANASATAPSVASPSPLQNGNVGSNIANDLTSTIVLAVEGAPEHSNLDNLPTSYGQKRKRSAESDDKGRFTRGHGGWRGKKARRGGKGGPVSEKEKLTAEQPNSSIAMNVHMASALDDVAVKEDDPPVEKKSAGPPSPRVTRRQTRLFGSNDAQAVIKLPPTPRMFQEETKSPKSVANSDATLDEQQAIVAPQAHEDTAKHDEDNDDVNDNDSTTTTGSNELLGVGLSISKQSNCPTAQTEDDQKVDKPRPQTAGPETAETEHIVDEDIKTEESGTVKILARVETGDGIVEIALDEHPIAADENLRSNVLRYVAWTKKMGEKSKNISFEMWCSIHSFGR